MCGMRRRILCTCTILLLCLCIAGCGNPETGFQQPDIYLEEERLSQDLTDLQGLEQPEEIVFYHKGKQTVYSRGNTDYAEIFRLNQERLGTGFRGAEDALSGSWNDDDLKKLDFLEYRYKDTYYPIFFQLDTTITERCVVQQEEGIIRLYGFTKYSRELMKALGVKEPEVPEIWSWEERSPQSSFDSIVFGLMKPDKIIFYHKGEESVYEKGSAAFEEIFKLNEERNDIIVEDERGVLIEVREPQIKKTDRKWKDEYLEKYDFLEYRYEEKAFYSVYQRISKKEKDNWLAQQEGDTIQMYTNARVSKELFEYLGLN